MIQVITGPAHLRAGDENRTRVPSLGSLCSASELHPQDYHITSDSDTLVDVRTHCRFQPPPMHWYLPSFHVCPSGG